MIRSRLLLLIIIGLAVLVASSLLLYQAKEGVELFPNRSTYSARAGGYKALYLTIEELGYPPVGRWKRRLLDLVGPEDALVITSLRPGESIGERERDALVEWVADGGRLVLLGDFFPVEPGFASLLDSFQLSAGWDEFGETGEPLFPMLPGGSTEVPAVQPTAYTRGVERVEAGSSMRMEVTAPDHVVHLADEHGSLCVSLRYGRGKVIAVADADLGSNQRIDRAHNLRFLLNVLTHEWGAGTVWFDEYHHGFREEEGLMAYAARSPAAPVLAQVGLLAAVWLLATARRFGPLRPLPPAARRRTAEHVDCLAALYAMTHAHSFALRGIYRRFRTDAARLCGLPPSSEAAKVAMTYARKFGYNADELRDVMTQCEAAQERDDLRPGDLLRLVRTLERFSPPHHQSPEQPGVGPSGP